MPRRAALVHHPWHDPALASDIVRRRWAAESKPKRPGRPPTHRRVVRLVLRMAADNEHWGYRRIAGELAGLGIAVAPSTVWVILKRHGIDPAPRRSGPGWAQFLRSQAEAILALDLFTVDLLDGTKAYVLAANRCSTASWWCKIKISAVFHASSRRDSRSPGASRVIRRKTNRRHMIGDHHGRTAGGTTLLVRAVDAILGTKGEDDPGPRQLAPLLSPHSVGAAACTPASGRERNRTGPTARNGAH
jgi:hypothetical protein